MHDKQQQQNEENDEKETRTTAAIVIDVKLLSLTPHRSEFVELNKFLHNTAAPQHAILESGV